MRKFVFVLGGSSVSSAIDDILDVFNEKMGQNLQICLFQPLRLLISVICAGPPSAYSGLKSTTDTDKFSITLFTMGGGKYRAFGTYNII